MSEYKVIVTDDRFNDYKEEAEVLEPMGVKLLVHNFTTGAELLEAAAEADGLLVNLFPMTSEIIRGLKKCKVLSRYGVGCDNVDIEAATEAGIWVANVPDYAVEDVADHTMGMLISCARQIHRIDRGIRNGKWNIQNGLPIRRIKGTTLGIVGYGRIGKSFHKKAKALGFGRILIVDPHVNKDNLPAEGGSPATLEQICREADYISLHACLKPETRGMIGEKQFRMMKKEAVLINTARGGIVDEGALIRALQEQRIAGAGLDVLAKEPPHPDNPLLAMENVIMTSHMAYYSEESIIELKRKAAKNIASVFKVGEPVTAVNRIAF